MYVYPYRHTHINFLKGFHSIQTEKAVHLYLIYVHSHKCTRAHTQTTNENNEYLNLKKYKMRCASMFEGKKGRVKWCNYNFNITNTFLKIP